MNNLWIGMILLGIVYGAVTGNMQAVTDAVFASAKGHKAQEYIAANMIANILGLGSAATPAGLKAMEELAEIKKEKGLPEEVASNEMCTFLILNISSLQLIPVSVIAYRSQYGSSNPSAITGAAIAATLVSTATAVIFCKIKEKMTKDTF